ncbi:MAG: hypothetical protein ABIJ10_03590 [Candidatus Micrarchaeota archaeon]
MSAKNPKKALLWIVGILKKHSVQFQISGGLAARVYGSQRPLNDIDIDIPEEKFEAILNDVKDYIIYEPSWYKDKVWDLYLMTLNYHGQEIDIGGAYKIKICDERTGKWHDFPADFSTVEMRVVFDISVPVISRKALIWYKNILAVDGQPHQKEDIGVIKKFNL